MSDQRTKEKSRTKFTFPHGIIKAVYDRLNNQGEYVPYKTVYYRLRVKRDPRLIELAAQIISEQRKAESQAARRLANALK